MFKRTNAGGGWPGIPEFDFEFFECIYCKRWQEGKLKNEFK